MTDRFVTVPDTLELPVAVKVPSARLSDSGTAGRAALAAADAAALRTAAGLGTAATTAASDYATAGQGTKADSAAQPAGDLGGTATAPTVTGGTHHGHTASQLSDVPAAGQALITAADAAAQRAALGVTPLVSSPRGGTRLPLDRQPSLVVASAFPNAYADHRILYADDTKIWAWGQDSGLRYSVDGGVLWSSKTFSGLTSGVVFAKRGMFFKTQAGTWITTSSTAGSTTAAPEIVRSTDGATWTAVVAAQTDVDYLGPTSIAQDPTTGTLYLTEYVVTTAAAKATWKIIKSTDDGATWSTLRTFQRDATAYPTTAVRHGHAVQWDPVGLRMWFMCGDGEAAAGMYRLNVAGTDVDPMITNSQLDTANHFYAGAVGMMFFPNYVAWGVDQRSDSGLIRVARSELGQVTPVAERVCMLSSTAFYTYRTDATTSDEWLLTVSDENGTGGRLDIAHHIYRVADDAGTVDEVLSIPTSRSDSFSWPYFIMGSPLATFSSVGRNAGAIWMGTDMASAADAITPDVRGFQFVSRLLWSGGGSTLMNPRSMYPKPFYASESVCWYGSLTASQVVEFAADEVPSGLRRLYIINVRRDQTSGAGKLWIDVYNSSTGAIVKLENNSDASFEYRSQRTIRLEPSAPYAARTGLLTAGNVIRFRVRESLGDVAAGMVGITFAWGI